MATIKKIVIIHSEDKDSFQLEVEIKKNKKGELDIYSDFGNIEVRFVLSIVKPNSNQIPSISELFNDEVILETELKKFLKSEGYIILEQQDNV